MLDLPDYALIGASSADLMVTELALADGDFREFNPIIQNRAVRITRKVVTTVVVIGVAHKLKRNGHRRAATTVRWIAIGAWSAAAIWNARLLKMKRDRDQRMTAGFNSSLDVALGIGH